MKWDLRAEKLNENENTCLQRSNRGMFTNMNRVPGGRISPTYRIVLADGMRR